MPPLACDGVFILRAGAIIAARCWRQGYCSAAFAMYLLYLISLSPMLCRPKRHFYSRSDADFSNADIVTSGLSPPPRCARPSPRFPPPHDAAGLGRGDGRDDAAHIDALLKHIAFASTFHGVAVITFIRLAELVFAPPPITHDDVIRHYARYALSPPALCSL